MLYKTNIIVLLVVLSMSQCTKNLLTGEVYSEDTAILTLTKEIYSKKTCLAGKKLAVFSFTNLDGKETSEGKRLSNRLLEQLLKNGNLQFIERTELDKILKAQGIEHSGLVDQNTRAKIGKIYNIEIMINGTITHVADYGELTIKAVNIQSGEIHIMATVKFRPVDKHIQQDDPRKIRLNQEDPEKLKIMNITYNMLQKLDKEQPLAFLLAVSYKNDPDLEETPELAERLKHALRQLQNSDQENYSRLKKLREGVQLLRVYDNGRYTTLMHIKKRLISNKLQ